MRRVLLAVFALTLLSAPVANAGGIDPKDPVPGAVAIVKCAGEALGGHACG